MNSFCFMRSIHRALLRNARWFGALCLALAPSLASPQALYTGTLVSNTDQPVFSSIPAVFAGQWLASPFLTGPAPAQLGSATLFERTFWVEGSFWVMVYSDNNGVPGALLPNGNLSGPAMPVGDAYQTYSATLPVFLDANTRYWIVAASDNPATHGGGYGWGWTNSREYTSDVGWSLFDYSAFTPDGGITWISTETAPGRNPLLLSISGTIIPEPGFLSLITPGLAFLLWKRRSRK